MAPTEFHSVQSPEEACLLLERHGAKAAVLAGGTDLGVRMNRHLVRPEVLVYIKECGLSYIRSLGDRVVIGATTSLSEIASSPTITDMCPLLAKAVSSIGLPSIRNMGTIGGNLANASPAADSAPALLALDATVILIGSGGKRQVPLAEFFTGPGQTVLRPGEIIAELEIPLQPRHAFWTFDKVGRRKAHTLSVVSLALLLEMEASRCRRARISLGAVAPVPLRAREAEGVLEGQLLTPEVIARAAQVVGQEIQPIDDGRATAGYRRHLAQVLVHRGLERARTEWSGMNASGERG